MKDESRQPDFFWLLAVITAAFCAFVLLLPAFPSEDGPIHLYFATILGHLLANDLPLYAQYYYVHHILPPYSLHYYLLILLMRFVSALAAEKLFVCLIFCTFAFGFRYLLTGIGRAGNVLSLFAGALLLNWPLGMGFENFSLSLGMACWVLGLWVRLPSMEKAPRARLGFVLLLALMTLTHPVPVIMTVAFATMDIALRVLASLLWKQKLRSLAADVLTVLGGACTLGYINLYTDKKRSIAEAQHHPPVPWAQLKHFAALHGLAYFGGQDAGAMLYRGALYLVFALGLACGLRMAMVQLRKREWTPAMSWFVAAGCFIAALPLIPIDINGSHFFSERLVIFVWMALLAAASGIAPFSRAKKNILATVAVAISVGVLIMAQLYMRPVAQQLAQLEHAPAQDRGKVGILMPANDTPYDFSGHLQFYPLIWGGTYYFRTNQAVLLNTPWMDLSLLPLGATARLLTGQFPLNELENYHELREAMLQSNTSRNLVIPRSDFALFAGPGPQVQSATIQPMLDLAPTANWSCSAGDWYELCRK